MNVKWSRWFVVLTELVDLDSIVFACYDYAYVYIYIYGKNRIFPATYALISSCSTMTI